MQEQQSSARYVDRYSHIDIRLRYRCKGEWEQLHARGWNARGFNFFSQQHITEPVLELKRGLLKFDAEVVWSRPNTSDEVMEAALINELIYMKSREVGQDVSLQARLLKLIRTPGLIPEKKNLLSTMGHQWTDQELATELSQRRSERPMYHYGVKVESETWQTIVNDAMHLSSVVMDMEKWSDALTTK